MKLMAVILSCFLLVSGCSTLAKVCDNQTEADRIKTETGKLLQQAQSGYATVMRIAGSSPNPAVAVAAAAIDGALKVLGEIYFDKVCPMIADYNAAKYAADVAQQAKVEIAIKTAAEKARP
jgi:hypothetical protein